MPFTGLGLHGLIAPCFAVHAVRSGRQTRFRLRAASRGERGLAVKLHAEVEQSMRRRIRHTRTPNEPLLYRLRETYAAMDAAA